MSPEDLPKSGVETVWITDVESALPALEGLLKKIPSEYRSAAFERLFEIILQDARKGRPAVVSLVGSPPQIVAQGTARFQKFLTDYGFSPPALANLVDPDSGQILARNLGANKAESQRRLAALIALSNAERTGEFSIPRDQLVQACKEHGAYDQSNFAANMSGIEFNGVTVFVKDGMGGFKVSRPGEAYVAEVVKSLLP